MLKVATALPNEPYREYKDVERVYSGSTEIDKILDKNGNVLFAVNKEVEGTPALMYKGKEETNLKNYRIYGQSSRNLFDKTRNTIPDAILNEGVISASAGVGGYLIYAPITPLQTYTFRTNGTIRHGLRSAFTINKPALSVSYVIDNVNTHYNHDTNNEFTRQAPLNANWIVIQIRDESALAYDNMLNSGSIALPYEPYGESVGDRTGNLFDSNINVISGYLSDEGILKPARETSQITFDYIPIISGTYTFTYTVPLPSAYQLWFCVCTYDESRTFQSRLVSEYSGAATFTIPDTTKYIRISLRGYNKTPIIMLNIGSTALPYEPYGYKMPVTVSNGTDTLTTPIYLPEPIKMVGDEAEYVDYAEQKWHRVRKNLLQNTATSQTIRGVTVTVNADGSITCNGTATGIIEVRVSSTFSLTAGNYLLTGCPSSGSGTSYFLRAWYFISGAVTWINDTGAGRNFTLADTATMQSSIVINSGQVLDHITFYPMIRKADIEDDTYEPYIENTDLDVTLPALPVLPRTNVLSVGTEVQPSNVYLKGRIKEVS